MRWQKAIRSAVVTTFAMIATVLVVGATPASAAGILLVNPNTISAGFQVQLHATCGDNVNPAFVSSKAFGSVTLVPDKGALRENVTVPSNTRSGTYTVDLTCASGQTASSKLTVIGDGGPPNPNRGPHTGGGQMASSMAGKLTLYGGLGAIVVGLGVWLVLGTRRRTSV